MEQEFDVEIKEVLSRVQKVKAESAIRTGMVCERKVLSTGVSYTRFYPIW